MHFLFSRHGDTFEPGQKVVWVGKSNDVPLAASGKQQAVTLAQNLQQRRIVPARIFCAPLRRTKEYAEIVLEQLGISAAPEIDARLSELDYGDWSGLSSEEIEQRFGKNVLQDWEKRSVWPKSCGWGGSESEVMLEVRDLVADCRRQMAPHEVALFFTSNGRLRFLLKLVPGEFEARLVRQDFKVKTGNVGLLEDEDGELNVLQWNISPTELRLKG